MARAPKGSGFREQSSAYRSSARVRPGLREEPDRRTLKLGPGGRVVIPAEWRRAMEIDEGERLVATLEDGELRLVGRNVALRNAQAFFQSLVPEGVSLVDELIADRRREAEAEDEDG